MLVALEDISAEVRRAPMLRAAAAFMAGLVAARLSAPSVGVAWIVGGCVFLIALLILRRTSYERRWIRGALLSLVMFGLGVLWWTLRDPLGSTTYANAARGHVCMVELVEASYAGDRSARFEGRILADTLRGASLTGHRVLLTLGLDSAIDVPVSGDRLWIDADPRAIDRIPDPGGFDARGYSGSRGIALEVYVPADHWRKASHTAHWTDVFATARVSIARWLRDSGLPRRERALAKALLIGVKDELELDQKTSFVRSGTMHVLAVSGAHVGIIWAVLNGLLVRLGNKTRPRIIRGILILLALWAYAGLTGAEASVLRATVMCSLFTIGGIVQRAAGHINSLFAAALVLLVWDPIMLWQLSFQLSFMAVLGIILFYKPLLHLWHPPGWLLHQVWSATAVSLAAQLTTTPLSLLVFKSFPIWFLPANIVVAGVVAAAVYGSALLVMFFKVPLLGFALTWCMTKLLFFLGWATALFGALPGAYPGVRIDPLQCFLLYLFMACAAIWFSWPGRVSRWATAVSSIAVLVTWGVNAHRLQHTIRFAAHGSRSANVVSVQKGRDLVLFADSAAMRSSAMPRAIEAQQRATGAEHVLLQPWIDLRTGTDHGIIEAGTSRIAFAGPEVIDHRFPLEVDRLVLDQDGSYDMDRIMRAYAVRSGVVLSPVIDGLERWRIRKWCEQKKLACHDVKRQGAFILETSF